MAHVHLFDVSEVIELQKDKSHQIYETAMELNYSHEQMTPLNNIINNSKMIIRELKKLDLKSSELCHN